MLKKKTIQIFYLVLLIHDSYSFFGKHNSNTVMILVKWGDLVDQRRTSEGHYPLVYQNFDTEDSVLLGLTVYQELLLIVRRRRIEGGETEPGR